MQHVLLSSLYTMSPMSEFIAPGEKMYWTRHLQLTMISSNVSLLHAGGAPHGAAARPRFQSWGVQFLALGYYCLSPEKIRKVYPVWRSLLPPTKKLRKKLGPIQIWGVRTPLYPKWLRPLYGARSPRHGIWHGASRKLNPARTVEKRAALM